MAIAEAVACIISNIYQSITLQYRHKIQNALINTKTSDQMCIRDRLPSSGFSAKLHQTCKLYFCHFLHLTCAVG